MLRYWVSVSGSELVLWKLESRDDILADSR